MGGRLTAFDDSGGYLADVLTCYNHHSSDEVLSDGLRIRLLTAQRNMYISGFCLFLFLYDGSIVVVGL